MSSVIHDAGLARFYRLRRDETDPEDRPQPEPVAEQTFGELTVGLTRFYSAAGVSQRADRLIEIWRDTSITVRDLCRIGDTWYLIRQAAQGENDDGLLVTRLTLEETDGSAWEGEQDGD